MKKIEICGDCRAYTDPPGRACTCSVGAINNYRIQEISDDLYDRILSVPIIEGREILSNAKTHTVWY